MTIGFGILFKDKALLCIDSCEYLSEEKQKFNLNAVKYYKLSDSLFYIQAGLTNASRYVVKKMIDLKIDSFNKLESILNQDVLSDVFGEFIRDYSKKHPHILKSFEFNYYTLIFAGRKEEGNELFLVCMRFCITNNGKISYDYCLADKAPAMFTTLLSRDQDIDGLYEELKCANNIKTLRKACVAAVEKLSKKSPYISPWGVFIELDKHRIKTRPFNSLKRICYLLKTGIKLQQLVFYI